MPPVVSRMDQPNMFAAVGNTPVTAPTPQAGMVPAVPATSPQAPVQPSNYTGQVIGAIGGGLQAVGAEGQRLSNAVGLPQAIERTGDLGRSGDYAGALGAGAGVLGRAAVAGAAGLGEAALSPFVGAGMIGMHVLHGMFGGSTEASPAAGAAQAPSGNVGSNGGMYDPGRTGVGIGGNEPTGAYVPVGPPPTVPSLQKDGTIVRVANPEYAAFQAAQQQAATPQMNVGQVRALAGAQEAVMHSNAIAGLQAALDASSKQDAGNKSLTLAQRLTALINRSRLEVDPSYGMPIQPPTFGPQ